MSIENPRRLGSAIVLSGPSGVGKSTLVAILRQNHPELDFSISCTTRKPRPGEQNHVHYHFLSEEEFSRKTEAGEFIEHAGIFLRRYGTLRSEVIDRICAGHDVLLDIDVQGARQIRQAAQHDPLLAAAVEFVFLAPPSRETLEARLRGRMTETEEQLRVRIAQARTELAAWKQYDYIIVNDTVECASHQLETLFQAFHLATKRMPEEPFL